MCEKCWACSLLTVAEARKPHDGATPCGYLEEREGDGCWHNTTCPSRRSYYRKGRGRLAQRQGATLAVSAKQPETVVVPIPAISYMVLHTYLDQLRQPQDDVVIHAMCAELWVGGQP